MYRSRVSQEIFVQEKTKTNAANCNLSRSIVALLALCQLGFGFNFGFSKIVDAKFQGPIKCITVVMGCLMICLLPISFLIYEFGAYWRIIYFIQYIPTFLILLSAKYTLCEFLNKLTSIKNFPEHGNMKIGPIAWTSVIIIFVVKFSTAVVYCSYNGCNNSYKSLVNFLMHIPILGLDVIPVANFLLFYHVHAQMKDVKISLELREITLETLLATYKDLTDDFDKLRSNYDAIFVWGFLTESPKWMMMIWHQIITMKSSNSWVVYACTCAWAAHITLEICAPAVYAEMALAQAEAVQMILHERLSTERDGPRSQDLSRALRYLRARPLAAPAWRLVPLDMRLPVAMLSMGTTYLVVIIQFAHLFD